MWFIRNVTEANYSAAQRAFIIARKGVIFAEFCRCYSNKIHAMMYIVRQMHCKSNLIHVFMSAIAKPQNVF